MTGWRLLALQERWIKRHQELPDPAIDDRREAVLAVVDALATAAIIGGPIVAFLATRRG